MQTRTLGTSGLEVSTVGLGCMGMPDFYGSKATRDDVESVATIRAAVDAGVTLVDTADFYRAVASRARRASGHRAADRVLARDASDRIRDPTYRP